jgi:hypothetical protein
VKFKHNMSCRVCSINRRCSTRIKRARAYLKHPRQLVAPMYPHLPSEPAAASPGPQNDTASAQTRDRCLCCFCSWSEPACHAAYEYETKVSILSSFLRLTCYEDGDGVADCPSL